MRLVRFIIRRTRKTALKRVIKRVSLLLPPPWHLVIRTAIPLVLWAGQRIRKKQQRQPS